MQYEIRSIKSYDRIHKSNEQSDMITKVKKNTKVEYKSLISDNGEYIEKNISRRYLCEGMVERERLGVETNSFREKGLSVEATFRPLMRSIGSRGTKPFIEAHCPSQSS